MWDLPGALKIIKKQSKEGNWEYPGKQNRVRGNMDYAQLETYRNLGILIEQYGFNKQHPAIQKAATYFFSQQASDGDFRGIYGHQYSPNYTAGIAELLIKAGYENDPHITNVFNFLNRVKQDDGGWAIPFRTVGNNLEAIAGLNTTLQPDLSKPSSYMVTAVVLRAFAAHPVYRKSDVAHKAAGILISYFFKKDVYPDRSQPGYWTKFTFPFWFTDLISALDSLTMLGISYTDTLHRKQMEVALSWFIDHQQKDGLWDLQILKGREKEVLKLWLALSICRVFKRFYN